MNTHTQNYILAFLLLFLTIHSLEIGIQLNAHVRIGPDQKPETFSQVLKVKNGNRTIKADAFIKYKT